MQQDNAAQIAALKAAGCERIFQEKTSGGRWDRPELQAMLGHLRPRDTVVVWKLDRLSRSLKEFLLILEKIEAAQANFKSLTEAVDTGTPGGPDDDAHHRQLRRGIAKPLEPLFWMPWGLGVKHE